MKKLQRKSVEEAITHASRIAFYDRVSTKNKGIVEKVPATRLKRSINS